MTEITSFTKQRMDDLQDSTIDSAAVSGSTLQFTRKDGGVVDIGDVSGPQGPVGPDGPVTVSDIVAAINALQPGDWDAIPLENFWDVSGDPTSVGYRIHQDRVFLKGTITYTGLQIVGGAWLVVTDVFPVNARPIYDTVIGGYYNFEEYLDLRMYIDGIMRIYIPGGRSIDSSNGAIALDGISWSTT